MRFWAVGVVCVYVGIGLFNWVTGLHWLAEFSLPLSILGGFGLAIASTTAIPPEPTSTAPSSEAISIAESNTESTPLDKETKTAPLPPNPTPSNEPSISFTINKNVRP
ncbi:MAG: hypothetical protein AAGF93_07760 [Cyanobacteria bacterium P01_H01_bin.105]